MIMHARELYFKYLEAVFSIQKGDQNVPTNH
jgi:hypothetical protein